MIGVSLLIRMTAMQAIGCLGVTLLVGLAAFAEPVDFSREILPLLSDSTLR